MCKDIIIGVIYFIVIILIILFITTKIKAYKQRNFKNMIIFFVDFVIFSFMYLLLIDKYVENSRKLKNWILFILSIVLTISGVSMLLYHSVFGPGLPRPLLLIHVLCSGGILVFGLEHIIKRWPAL